MVEFVGHEIWLLWRVDDQMRRVSQRLADAHDVIAAIKRIIEVNAPDTNHVALIGYELFENGAYLDVGSQLGVVGAAELEAALAPMEVTFGVGNAPAWNTAQMELPGRQPGVLWVACDPNTLQAWTNPTQPPQMHLRTAK